MEETTTTSTPSATTTPEPSPATPASPMMSSPMGAGSDSTHPDKEGSGAVVWVLVSIIVLVVLGFGGYYIWSSNQVADVSPVTTPTPEVSPTTASVSATPKAASDEATSALNKVSSADDTTSLKKDLDSTDLNGIDKENAEISKQAQ